MVNKLEEILALVKRESSDSQGSQSCPTPVKDDSQDTQDFGRSSSSRTLKQADSLDSIGYPKVPPIDDMVTTTEEYGSSDELDRGDLLQEALQTVPLPKQMGKTKQKQDSFCCCLLAAHLFRNQGGFMLFLAPVVQLFLFVT